TPFTDMDAGLDLIDVPEDEVLFQKMYYSMSLVAGMFKVNQSLIRFWENEFDKDPSEETVTQNLPVTVKIFNTRLKLLELY
ncbi:MAG: hypothetical protein ABJA70_11640, partial [Chryseolinea sp.]